MMVGARIAGLVLFTLLSTVALAADLATARSKLQAGDLAGAASEVEAVLVSTPGDPQARFLKGVILAEQQRTQEAIVVFESLARDHPELPEPHNNLAVLHAAAGAYDQARDALLVAIDMHPSYATAHENLGDIYAKMAGIAYSRAVELDGANTTARTKLGLVDTLFEPAARQVASAPAPASIRKKAPAAAPAPTVSTASAPRISGSGALDQALPTVYAWAQAWSAQDVDAYLSFYADDFQPSSGGGRATWAAQRRNRLKRPAFIEVAISDAEVTGEEELARVTFNQRYRSNTYSDEVRKEMLLELSGDDWKIVSERSVP